MRRAVWMWILFALVGAATLGTAGPAAAEDVPYTDPAQVGYIGFCAHGSSIDSGSLDSIPFAAKAVSSVAAPAQYGGKGRAAYVNAYQPREGVTPAEWSGEALIATSVYSNPAHPMVVGTKGDISLRQFVGDFPAAWDGFVQIRMYLEASDVPYDPLHYVATDIQVDGDAWHVVRGADVACNSGKATSLTSVLAPKAASGKLNAAAPGSPRSKGSGSTATSPPPSPAVASGSLATPTTAAQGVASSSGEPDASSKSSFPTGYVVLSGLVVILGAALALSQRRRLQEWLASRRGDPA